MSEHDYPPAGLPQPPPPGVGPRASGQRPPPPPPVWASTPIPAQGSTQPAQTGVFAPSFFRAVLCGIGGAVVGAAIWYALVVLTDRQFVYVSIGLGFAIGFSVSWGAGKGGPTWAVMSALIAVLAVAGAYYYINRHLIIAEGEQLGAAYDIPLIPTFEELKIVLRVGYEADGSQYFFSGLCVAAAAFFGFKGAT